LYPIERVVFKNALGVVNDTITQQWKVCKPTAIKNATAECVERVKVVHRKGQRFQPLLLEHMMRTIAQDAAFNNSGPMVRRTAHAVAKEEADGVGGKAANKIGSLIGVQTYKTKLAMVAAAKQAARILLVRSAATHLEKTVARRIEAEAIKAGIPAVKSSFQKRLQYQPEPRAWSPRADPVQIAIRVANSDRIFQQLKTSVATKLAVVIETEAANSAQKAAAAAAARLTSRQYVHTALASAERQYGKQLTDICSKDAMKIAVNEANLVLAELRVMDYRTQAYTWKRSKELVRRHMLATIIGEALRVGRKRAKVAAIAAGRRAAAKCIRDPTKQMQIEDVVESATKKAVGNNFISEGLKICAQKPTGKEAEVAHKAALKAGKEGTIRNTILKAELVVHQAVALYAHKVSRGAAEKVASKAIRSAKFDTDDAIGRFMLASFQQRAAKKAQKAIFTAVKDAIVAKALVRFKK